MIDAVLLDLDGCLVDSREAIRAATNEAIAAYGRPPVGAAEIERHIGPPLLDTFTELLGPGDALAGLAAYRERYAVIAPAATPLFPRLEPVLRKLAGRFRLAVATSKPRRYAVPILEHLGVAGLFEHIVGPDLDATGETKAETVGRALALLGLAGEHAVMVGDRRHDVEGARAHGMDCIGVLWGYGDERELAGAGAAHLVRTPNELGALLVSL